MLRDDDVSDELMTEEERADDEEEGSERALLDWLLSFARSNVHWSVQIGFGNGDQMHGPTHARTQSAAVLQEFIVPLQHFSAAQSPSAGTQGGVSKQSSSMLQARALRP